MANKLYVGNLSAGTTDAQLQAMFARFGKVSSAHVAADDQTGKSRGFGFVEMPDTRETEAAIKGLNGKEHDGLVLIVSRPGPRLTSGGRSAKP
ncbi:MAG: RNA-binding protein [Planctomycetota bacterium]